MTDIIQGKDGHYTRERRTLQQGETDFIMVPQFFAVSRFSFVAKDIGIPIVFIQNGVDGKSIENDNRLRLSI